MVTAAELRLRTRLGLARAQLPSLQQRTIDPFIPNGQLQLEQDTARVEQDIKIEGDRLADLQRQLQQEGLTSSEKGSIDDRIGEQRRLLSQLSRAKSNIQQGFTFESAVSRATQTAGFETQRIEQLREAGAKGLLTPAQARSLLREKFAEARELAERPGITIAGKPIITKPKPKIPTPTLFPSVVSVSPTFRETFEREVRESTPELSLIPEGKIQSALQDLLGLGLGTFSFSKSKAQGFLTNLKDAEGKKIFTPDQAKNIVNIGTRISETLPEEGLVGLPGVKAEIGEPPIFPLPETELTKFDITQPTGIETTAVLTQREKTFFEKFGVNPEDRSSQVLKGEFDRIQLDFTEGRLTEAQASVELEKATDDFTREQIIKGVAANAALGVAFGLLQATPAGRIINILVGTDFFLKRKAVITQFQKFPKESALSTGSFLVGGFVGSKLGFGIKGRVSDIKINADNLESVTFITGKEKTKLTEISREIFPDINVLIREGRITDTIAYTIKLKDGKEFRVIEFSKLVNGKIDKQFIGFEVSPGLKLPLPRGTAFLGRGVGEIRGGKGELFSRIIKFELANTPLGKSIKKFFPSGRLLDIVERTEITGVRDSGMIRATQIRSIAGILRNERAKSGLVKEVSKFIDDINAGKPISILRLKKLINLNRKLQGKKPFTEIEFQSAKIKVLTDTQILNILKNLKINFERVDIAGLKTLSRQLTITQKDIIVGQAVTKGLKIKEAPKKPLTPLEVTFKEKFKEPEILKRAKALAKLKPFSKLKRVKGKLKTTETPVSVSTSALAALSSLDKQRLGFIPAFSGGTLSTEFGLTPMGITNSLGVVINTLGSVDREVIRIKSLPAISPFVKNKLVVLEKQQTALLTKQRTLNALLGKMKTQDVISGRELVVFRNALKTKQALQQQLKLRQRQRLRRRLTERVTPRLGRPRRPRVPPPIFPGGVPKKKPVKKIPKKIEVEFTAFVRKRGKDIKFKTFKTKKAARKGLKKQLSTTLRASGFITDVAGKKIKPKVTRGFRISKIDPFRIVERRRRRLDTGSEVRAIKEAKLRAKPLIKLKRKRK